MQGVDPEIVAHPANCQLLLQSDNSRKKTHSSITLEELVKRISEFKHVWPRG